MLEGNPSALLQLSEVELSSLLDIHNRAINETQSMLLLSETVVRSTQFVTIRSEALQLVRERNQREKYVKVHQAPARRTDSPSTEAVNECKVRVLRTIFFHRCC